MHTGTFASTGSVPTLWRPPMLPLRAVLAGSLLFVTTAAAQTSPLSTANQPDTTVAAPKDPALARLIGIIPGAGHMYAGEVGRGFLYLGGTLGIFVTGGVIVLSAAFSDQNNQDAAATAGWATLIATGGLWGWSIVDAGRAARRTNAKAARRTSLILEPTAIPVANGGDRAAVRLGVRISAW
jgi:TM2 domain-containing membrane protein YozV